jgi:hypothetical protein
MLEQIIQEEQKDADDEKQRYIFADIIHNGRPCKQKARAVNNYDGISAADRVPDSVPVPALLTTHNALAQRNNGKRFGDQGPEGNETLLDDYIRPACPAKTGHGNQPAVA